MTTLKRQFITDDAGQPIGIILPLEEFYLVEELLDVRVAAQHMEAQLQQMESAVRDPLFLADLHEAMVAHQHSDAEWWERA